MKREPVGDEREQDSWLGTTLRQTPATAPDACLDAETLAAWADGGLSATASAAVELHASRCSRCTAVLAAMERGAPALPARHVWTPARVFRWLAPLTAAATAVAVWVAVLDRPITHVTPAPAHDLASPAPGTPEPGTAERGTLEPGTSQPRTPESRTLNRNPAPSTQNPEPQALIQSAPSARLDKSAAAEEQARMRDELRREGAAAQTLGAAADSAGAPPPAAAPPMASADTLAETAAAGATAQRSAVVSRIVVTSESTAPSNQLFRWRVIGSTSIERSTDGGKSWTKTTPLPGVAAALSVVVIRAVDAARAVARTSDSAEFYTTNGGLSWTRVQEKSAAPF